jgi:hypothetical protein
MATTPQFSQKLFPWHVNIDLTKCGKRKFEKHYFKYQLINLLPFRKNQLKSWIMFALKLTAEPPYKYYKNIIMYIYIGLLRT